MIISGRRPRPPFSWLRLAAASLFISASTVSSATLDPASIADRYDFVIVGGGLSGLVLASRLSEDPNTYVLVLEAGSNGDDVRDRINHPGLAYYNGILGEHGWGWLTIPQPNANNRQMEWPGGKVLGGSSAVNGLYYVRPSSIEIDAWHSLLSGMEGAENWTPDSFFAAMRKSETFVPPRDDIRQLGNIQYAESSHGTNGPLRTSYPGFLPDISGRWITTMTNYGISASADPANGDNSGAFLTTSTINPSNWTRSYARVAYIDPYDRPNLHILTNSQVSRIVFEGTKATSVDFGNPTINIKVDKEVIVTAGPIGSPTLLMHSGVGPRDMLAAAGVQTVVDLPGVGQHLQDHLSVETVYKTSAETAGTIYTNKTDPRSSTDEFLSYVNSAIAYVNAGQVIGDASAFRTQLNSQRDAAVSAYSTDGTVQAGYRALYQTYADTLLESNAGQVEILYSTSGTPYGPDTIAIQVALQRPFSHGQLYINSSNPFDKPVIDPKYLTHPADLEMIRQALKVARDISKTEPLNGIITQELAPGSNITSDDDLNNFIIKESKTEYHPSCSCSMLPKELGGVVDATLKVYGLDNVRVADSSIFPIEFAAHMMAPTYGLAEQAATIIKAHYSGNTGSTGPRNNNSTTIRNNGSLSRSQSSDFLTVWSLLALGFILTVSSYIY